MKKLTIVVPEGENNLSSIVGSYKLFSRANAYWKSKYGQPVFSITIAGTSDEVGFYDGLFAVRPQLRIGAVDKTDLIIVPSLNHNFEEALQKNTELVDWIRHQYTLGAEVASICTGAFLVAAAGLLDQKVCSTHWAAAKQLEERFPDLVIQTDRIITDEQGVYTNGGAYSFLNLLLYLIEKYYDRSTALYLSKVFQIEMDRHSQSPFIMFDLQKQHEDEAVRKAQQYMEQNLQERISVEQLCSKFVLGRRNFDRRFIKATGNTPLEYLQRLRIEAAKKTFETTRKTVGEVMYESGYSDAKAFRETFYKLTGLSPIAYRKRYNKEVLAV